MSASRRKGLRRFNLVPSSQAVVGIKTEQDPSSRLHSSGNESENKVSRDNDNSNSEEIDCFESLIQEDVIELANDYMEEKFSDCDGDADDDDAVSVKSEPVSEREDLGDADNNTDTDWGGGSSAKELETDEEESCEGSSQRQRQLEGDGDWNKYEALVTLDEQVSAQVQSLFYDSKQIPTSEPKVRIRVGGNKRISVPLSQAEALRKPMPAKKENSNKKPPRDLRYWAKRATLLKSHTLRQDGPRKFLCPTCPNLEAMDLNCFVAHLVFHGNNPGVCPECNWYLPKEKELIDRHWNDYHSDVAYPPSKSIPVTLLPAKVWECGEDNCDELFEACDERDTHEMTYHGTLNEPDDVVTCTVCSVKCRSLNEARLHKAKEHPSQAALDCCFCLTSCETRSYEGKPFRNIAHMTTHIIKEHPERIGPINNFKRTEPLVFFTQVCPMCGLVLYLIYYNRLYRHLNIDHKVKNQKNWTCPVCLWEYKHHFGWDHMAKRHWPDAPKTFVCQFCGKDFICRPSRNAHEKIFHMSDHKQARPFQCDVCGKGFPVKNYLPRHRRLCHPEVCEKEEEVDKQSPVEKKRRNGLRAGRVGRQKKVAK